MKIHFIDKCIIKKDNRRLWWFCVNCGEPHDMVIEDEYYNEYPYRIEARCVNCGTVYSISIDKLIDSTKWIEWTM